MSDSISLNILLVLIYSLVIILLFLHQNMISMYLMGFGMLVDAIVGLYHSIRQKNTNR